MVAQELAYASINIDTLTMDNRDSFRPQPEGGKDEGFIGDENGGNRLGTREGFQEQIDFDAEFAAIVATSLGEISILDGPADDDEEPEDVLKRSRGYDFAE